MAAIAEAFAAVLILIGSFFLLVGSIGLAKLPRPMQRLHAPTKATTLGIGCLLIASMLWFAGVEEALTFHEALIALFLFLTAPVSAQMIAKVHILRSRRIQAELPPTGAAVGWATLPQEKEPAEQNPRPA